MLQDRFIHTVSTKRLTKDSPTGGDADKETYVANLSNISCLIEPLNAEQVALADGFLFKNYAMYFDDSVDIVATDRVVWNSDEYIVKGVNYYQYGKHQHKKALLELPN